MVFLLGWRNLWRNPLRSLITIGGVASGYAVLMFLISLTEGMLDQMLNNGTDLLVGHVQIQHQDYLPDRDLYETLGGSEGTDWRALIERLLREPEVVAATARIHASGLASTGEYSAGVAIVGIDPVREAEVSGLQGQGTPRNLDGRGLLLGKTLKQELVSGEGAEIALVTQAADGTIGNDLYRDRGTHDTGMALLDRSLTLVHLADLQDLLALAPDRVHEIALKLRDPGAAEAVAARVNDSAILPPGAVARSWRSLLPTLSDYLDMATASYVFMIGLVALFAALGVLNTMLMSVFERIRELGMLSALGMRPARVVLTVLSESLALAAAGLGVGLALGSLLVWHLSSTGLDLRSWMGEISMLETRVDPVIPVVWSWNAVWWPAAGLVLASVAASLLPALRAAFVDPVLAIRDLSS